MKLQMLEATYHIKNIEQHTHKEHKEIFKKQKKKRDQRDFKSHKDLKTVSLTILKEYSSKNRNLLT